MPWILAILGIGALAVLLAPAYLEHKGQEVLSELGISESVLKAMYAAHRDADQRLEIARTLVSTQAENPTAARQVEAAAQANQLAIRRTAEFAETVDRFVKSGRTHPSLSVARDEAANMTGRATWREKDIDALRTLLPQQAPVKSQPPPQPSRPPTPTKQPSKSPRAR
jgi:hypothetical protein